MAEVGKTRMCVALASLGVESWQWLAVLPKRSSGVNWSDMSRRLESGSIETRQADMMAGTSEGHWQISRSCFEAFFRALRPSSTLQPEMGESNGLFKDNIRPWVNRVTKTV